MTDRIEAFVSRLHNTTLGEENWRARAMQLEARLRELTLSSSRSGQGNIEKRLGSILLTNIRFFWRWPLIPLQMYRAMKHHRKLSAGAFTDVIEQRSRLLFDRACVVDAPTALAELESPLEDGVLLKLLTRASEMAFVRGRSDLELSFAEHALEIEANSLLLDRKISSKVDLGEIAGAYEAYKNLQSMTLAYTDGESREIQARWAATPLVELALLDELEETGKNSISSVKDRICYILHAALPVTSNGYATRSHAVACALRDNGWDVQILARPGYPWDVGEGFDAAHSSVEIDGLTYRYCATEVSEKRDVVAYVNEAANLLTEQLAELKPELVIAASNYRVALMSLIACRRLGIPMIYEQRGRWELTKQSRDPSFVYDPSFQVQFYLEGRIAREADSVWTLTGGLRDLLVDQGVDVSCIQLLPNGANSKRFQTQPRDLSLMRDLEIPDDVPVIGYIGSFVDYEGLDDLLEAAILMKVRGAVFRLLLVGNESPSGEKQNSLTAALRERTEAAGLGNWVIMPGRVPYDEVASYYSIVDIAPFPRRDFLVCELVSPIKPLEAMAMGKLVVVSNVQALAEMCGWGERGIVVQKGSPSALADGLTEALKELETPSGIVDRAANFVYESRDWAKMVAQLQPGMRALVKNRSLVH